MIEVIENRKNGSGFDTLHSFEGWKIAFITYADQYGECKTVKRHTHSDEAFVLIKGEAKLFVCDEDEALALTKLEKEKLYVVKKNTWHHLQISRDALLIVVENSDVSRENTETKIMTVQ